MAPSPRSRCRAPAAAVTGLLFQGEALATHAAIQVGCPTSQDTGQIPFCQCGGGRGAPKQGGLLEGHTAFRGLGFVVMQTPPPKPREGPGRAARFTPRNLHRRAAEPPTALDFKAQAQVSYHRPVDWGKWPFSGAKLMGIGQPSPHVQ